MKVGPIDKVENMLQIWQIWETFIGSFSGKLFFFLVDDWTTSYSLCFYTDVAQSIGYGLIFDKQWAYSTLLDSWTDYHISVRIFFHSFGLTAVLQRVKNKRVLFL